MPPPFSRTPGPPRSRSLLLLAAAVAVLAGCGGASATAKDPPLHVARVAATPGCLLPLDPNLQPYRCGGAYAGAFNQAIPAGAATDPASSAFVAQMVAGMRRTRADLNDADGAPGVWIAARSDPVWTVTSARGQRTIRFPMPAAARPAPGTDAPLLVYDPANPTFGPYTELRAWRASVDAATHTIHTTEYGLFHYGRASGGRPFYGVGTGYGLSWAGLIRAWEVRTGRSTTPCAPRRRSTRAPSARRRSARIACARRRTPAPAWSPRACACS